MIHIDAPIGIVVPAHNEAQYLGACLESLHSAACHPALNGRSVHVVVVLDACTDKSLLVAREAGATCIELDARNVGAARDAGARLAISRGAHWLAFTDADSLVAHDWLAAQLAVAQSAACDAICGVVAVDDWDDYSLEVRAAYDAHYCNQDGHHHVHGANFSITSQAYLQAGGFRAMSCHEDVTLVQDLQALGKSIAWSALPAVRTSSRRATRVSGGFSDFLKSLENILPAPLAVAPAVAPRGG